MYPAVGISYGVLDLGGHQQPLQDQDLVGVGELPIWIAVCERLPRCHH